MKHLLPVIIPILAPLVLEAKCPSPDVHVTLFSANGSSEVVMTPPDFGAQPNHQFGTFFLSASDTIEIYWNSQPGCGPVILVERNGNQVFYSDQDQGSCRFAEPGDYHLLTLADGSETYGFTIAGNISTPTSLFVQPLVYLAGAMGGGLWMTDELSAQGLIPTTEPYSGLGMRTAGQGGEVTTPSILATDRLTAGKVVDWVLVELRSVPQPSNVIASRAGLLCQSGLVVDVDGESALQFFAPPGPYFVSVRHRNHLGAMLAFPMIVAGPAIYANFTYNHYPFFFGIEAVCPLDGFGLSRAMLWPGNASHSGSPQTIKYTGNGNDRDAILSAIGGAVPTQTQSGYLVEDVNLDGVVKYAGTANDRDVVLLSIGGAVPTQTRVEQVPH